MCNSGMTKYIDFELSADDERDMQLTKRPYLHTTTTTTTTATASF